MKTWRLWNSTELNCCMTWHDLSESRTACVYMCSTSMSVIRRESSHQRLVSTSRTGWTRDRDVTVVMDTTAGALVTSLNHGVSVYQCWRWWTGETDAKCQIKHTHLVWLVCVLYVPSVLWYCWLGLFTCKNHLYTVLAGT